MKVTKDITQAEWELELLGDVRDKTLHSQELMSKLTKVLVKNGQYQLASLDKIPSYFKKFDKQVVAGLLAINKDVTDEDIFTFKLRRRGSVPIWTLRSTIADAVHQGL